ncbi:MAG TPA: hypothetical protein VF903_07460 [Nitrospirota bacterium]
MSMHANSYPVFLAFSLPRNASGICTICLRFGGSFSTWLNRRQSLVSPILPYTYEGYYSIVADEKGLRVTEFAGPDGGPMPKGFEPLSNAWNLKGDFSLPKITRKKLYQNLEQEYEAGRFRH